MCTWLRSLGEKSKGMKYHVKDKELIIFLGLSHKGWEVEETLKGSLGRGVLADQALKTWCCLSQNKFFFTDFMKIRDLIS